MEKFKTNVNIDTKSTHINEEDKVFFDMAHRILDKANQDKLKANEYARIDLIFMTEGHNCIKKFLTEHHNSNEVVFNRSYIYPDICDYDVRRLMDWDFINEVAKMGYSYDEKSSTSELIKLIRK